MKLASRWAALPIPRGSDGLSIEPGTRRDYEPLSEHHYRAGKPATATRVLVIRSPDACLAARWRAICGEPASGADAVGIPEKPAVPIAVLVESLPALSCRMRDWALHDRYGGWLTPAERAKLLNAEVRCISRVVVHPQWRGQGLAVRLVRHALATATTPFTEALAAMGRVSPFFEKAGMTAYPRPSHPHDARLRAALERVGVQPPDLSRLEVTLHRIADLPDRDRRFVEKELHHWYRRAGGRAFDASNDPRDHLAAARDRLLLEPVYYVHQNG
jgi:GNAT superfamily N-acetyltransferase